MVVGCSDEKKQVVQQSETENNEGTNQTSENITAKETTKEKFEQLEKKYDARLGVYAIQRRHYFKRNRSRYKEVILIECNRHRIWG